MIKTLLLILVTIFIPPLGVLSVAGCGPDVLINLLLTLLGYLPGHVHAFYIEYVYYKKRDERRAGIESAPAQGVYSKKAQTGGVKSVVGGQVVHGGNVGVAPAGAPPAQ